MRLGDWLAGQKGRVRGEEGRVTRHATTYNGSTRLHISSSVDVLIMFRREATVAAAAAKKNE